MSNLLSKIWSKVEREPRITIEEIVFNLNKKDAASRLEALLHIRKSIEQHGLVNEYFDLAKLHIADNESDCRWQATIIIGSFMEVKPDEIWDLIIQHGSSAKSDIQAAIATVLLEHFFEKHPHLFKKKFPEIKREIKKGNKNLAKTLASCWGKFGDENNLQQVKRLLYA